MVDCSVRWEVVKGMEEARARGYGEVTRYLEAMGVPRSSAYRWELRLRWLLEFGPTELHELRKERDALYAQLRSLLDTQARVERMSREQERAFMLHMAVLGNSDAEIAAVLETVTGRRISHETVRKTINEAAALARVAFGRYFCDAGTVAAVDEIFLGKQPLLLAVEPVSLLILALRLADRRAAEDWKPVFEALGDLRQCLADGARGIGRAAADAGVPLQRDMFHFLRKPRAIVARLWARCEKLLDAELEAQEAYEATRAARQCYCRAREACEEALEACCRLDDLLNRVVAAFEWTTADGELNTSRRAERIVGEVIEALESPTGPKGNPAGAPAQARARPPPSERSR